MLPNVNDIAVTEYTPVVGFILPVTSVEETVAKELLVVTSTPLYNTTNVPVAVEKLDTTPALDAGRVQDSLVRYPK